MQQGQQECGQAGGHRVAAGHGGWTWALLRLKSVVAPVEWSVRWSAGGGFVVEANRGRGWRVEAHFHSLDDAFAHGRTLHGECLPGILRPPPSLSYKR